MPKNIENAPTPCCYRQNIVEVDDEISLLELFRVVWRQKAYVLLFVALSLIGTSTYLYRTPDVYKAEAIILPLQGRNTIALPSNLLGLEGLKEMIGENMPGMVEAPNSSRIKSLLASRRLNLMLVEKFDLLPILFSSQWDKSKQKWIGEETSENYNDTIIRAIRKVVGMNQVVRKVYHSSLDGAELLQKKIKTSDIKKENLVKIEFEDYDPNFAVLMITRYVDSLDEYLRHEAITRASDSRNYISTMLQSQSTEPVKKRLEELLLAFSEQELYANMKSSFLFEVIDRPILPERPFKPNRPSILALTLITSLFGGILLTFLIEAIKGARGNKEYVGIGDQPHPERGGT